MPAVDLVTIHHEGSLANGGAPSDDVARFEHGGYCCGLGETLFERWRAPAENYATLNYNGEDWTPCFSGDHHTGSRLRDADIDLLHAAYLDAYARGEVTADPLVRAHRNSPGSATACPGDYVIERWADIEAACRPGPLPPPAPTDEPAPPGKADRMIVNINAPRAAANEQPYAYLDTTARCVWSFYGLRIRWDGGSGGDSPLVGEHDPRSFGVPGTAPLLGWAELSRNADGSERRICAYGVQGAQYTGTAHA